MAKAAAKEKADPKIEETPTTNGEAKTDDTPKDEPAAAKSAAKPKAKRKRKKQIAADAPAPEAPNVVPARKKSKAKPKTKRKSSATMAATKTIKSTPKRKAPTMAKTKTRKSKTNKSEKIRQALAATPDKSAAEIAKAVGVTPALVYNVKANMAKKAKKAAKKKPGRKPGPKASTNGAPSANGHLDSALDFVTKVGGLVHAEQLIGKLKEIKEKL